MLFSTRTARPADAEALSDIAAETFARMDEKNELAAAFGDEVAQVDGAEGIARRIAHLLEGQSFAAQGPNRFVVTGPLTGAQGLEEALATHGFGPAEAF